MKRAYLIFFGAILIIRLHFMTLEYLNNPSYSYSDTYVIANLVLSAVLGMVLVELVASLCTWGTLKFINRKKA